MATKPDPAHSKMYTTLTIHYLLETDHFSSILLNNSDVTMKLSDYLCEKQLISSEERKAILEKTTPQDKADSLIVGINEVIIKSPDSLVYILEEMEKYDCLKILVKAIKEQEGKT